VETKRMLKNHRFASPVLHNCNVYAQICVTRPQCVNLYIVSHNLYI